MMKKTTQKKGLVDVGSYSTTTDFVPHHLYYCQTTESREAIKNAKGQYEFTPESIVCDNVDILVVGVTSIDAKHVDFLDKDGVTSRVKDFPWEQLWNPIAPTEKMKITTAKRQQMLVPGKETRSHDTVVASLAAGNRSGFGKLASIYPVPMSITDGIRYDEPPPVQGADRLKYLYQLILEFIKAKNQNKFGLNKDRPTIIIETNTVWKLGLLTSFDWRKKWASSVNVLRFVDNETKKFVQSLMPSDITYYSWGSSNQWVPRWGTVSDEVDSYVRKIVAAGAHFVKAAGNENRYMTKSKHVIGKTLCWDLRDPRYSFEENTLESFSTIWGTVAKQTYKSLNINISAIIPSDQFGNVHNYSEGFVFRTIKIQDEPFTYSSPGMGINNKPSFDENDMTNAVISVGDVIPIYEQSNLKTAHWASNPGHVMAKVLSESAFTYAVTEFMGAPSKTSYTRPNGESGPVFIKSPKSNWGPGVDIYAPGTGTWAAIPSTVASYDPHSPNYSSRAALTTIKGRSSDYGIVEGTSAAAAIVGGILATYLSQFPTASPGQAKIYLKKTGVGGTILETKKITEDIAMDWYHYDETNKQVSYTTYQAPIGALSENLILNLGGSGQEPRSGVDTLYFGKEKEEGTRYDKAPFMRIHDVLLGVRFFDSNNIVAQAYPLRQALYYNDPSGNLQVEGIQLKRASNVAIKNRRSTLR